MQLIINWDGHWVCEQGVYWYDGKRSKWVLFPREATYAQLLDKVYAVTGIDRNCFRVIIKTVAHTIRPSMPVEISDDDDVVILLRQKNVDPLVCITVSEIEHSDRQLQQQCFPESSNQQHHPINLQFPSSKGSNYIREGYTPNLNDATVEEEFQVVDDFSNEARDNEKSEDVQGAGNSNEGLVRATSVMCSINDVEVASRAMPILIANGEVFDSKKELHSQLRRYAAANRFNLKVWKSDTSRFEVRCAVGECKWRLHAFKVTNTDFFRITRFDDKHSCSMEKRFSWNRKASAQFIGQHIKEKFRDGRIYRPKQIIRDIQNELGITVNYHKGYRAKHIAMEEVHGSFEVSFSMLPYYCHMLEETNPGTITNIKTDDENRFMYLFFSIKACIDGFNAAIRPVIAIDATFLKGSYGGILFVAVCQDGNDQIFPLAFGVADSENDASWSWFLSRLHDTIGDVEDLVFVSDRKNSIVKAIATVFPNAYHGACFMHLERNMISIYKNKDLSIPFRKAAKAYRVNDHSFYMLQLSSISVGAHQYVVDAGEERWSRAFCPRKRYNIMTTNIAESMNNAVKDFRELPIVAMIDRIRDMMQRWFHDRRTVAASYDTQLTERVEALIGVSDESAQHMKVSPIAVYQFEVHDGKQNGIVDLENRTCSCREFDLDQIPCAHALAAIKYRGLHYTTFTSPYYSTAYLLSAYSGEIHPVGHQGDWLVPADVANTIVLPPVARRPPGRPKKQRIPSIGEEVVRRRCRNCWRHGHNSQTCKNPKVAEPSG